MEQTSLQNVTGTGDTAKKFAGLPIGLLICQPLLEAAKGQLAMCQVYIQTLMELAYNDPTDPTKGTRTISFTFDRLVVDQVTGEESVKAMALNVPMIALVPMPAFTMDEATVDFNMEVKESSVSADTSSESISNTDTFKFWGCSASITGNVAASQSRTRSTDSSAKYQIHARAVQQAPSDGMAKLTALFASAMEPIEKKES